MTVDGKRRTFTARTKQEADRKRRELVIQRDSGRLSTGKTPTVSNWLERWLEIKKHKPSTQAGYRQSIRLYIQPAIGHLRIDKVKPEHVEDLLVAMAKKGISGSGQHQTYSIIRASLAEAVRRGHVQRNAASILSAPKVSKVKAKSLSDAEVDAIIDAAAGTPLEARWHLSLLLGLRPGEVTGLEWKDVDLKKGRLHVRQQLQQNRDLGLIIVETPKSTAGDRVIPLPAYLVNMLRQHRKDEAKKLLELGDRRIVWSYAGHTPSFVFTLKHGQPVRPRDDDDLWRSLLLKAGVPFTRRYTARHTAASSMIASAIDVATVSETLGHHSPGFTMSVYVHSVDERKVSLASTIDRRVAGATSS